METMPISMENNIGENGDLFTAFPSLISNEHRAK